LFTIRRLMAGDFVLMKAMTTMFGEAFGEVDTYTGNPPRTAYIARLMERDDFIALAAIVDGSVVGGLVAYEFQKFEQERREIYIYDLAVAIAHRRKGIATALIEELRGIAVARSAYVIFVQADRGDEAAISLYTKAGSGSEVLHFDIAVRRD